MSKRIIVPRAGCDGKAITALNASSCRFIDLNKKYTFLHRCNLSQMYQHNFGQLFAQKKFIDQNELNMTQQGLVLGLWQAVQQRVSKVVSELSRGS